MFLVFISLYFTQMTGYYEYNNYKNKEITKEAMKKFENDLALNKDVVLTDYINIEERDYTNNISNLGYNISTKTEHILKAGIKKFFKYFSKYFIE